jgi:hypothetical protein
MKKGMTVIMASFFLVLILGGSSLAAPIQGAVYYNVTGYNLTTHNLQYGHGLAPASAILGGQFTVNALNFTTEGGQATYTQFLANNGTTGLVWDNPTSVAFGATNIVTDGTYTSFFQFHGFAYFSENFSIRHDDGLVLYIDDLQHIYDYSLPTSPEVANMSLASRGLSPGYHEFLLNYAAWNGFPEVLQITSGVQVPEPTTMLLLGLGMLGVAVLRRK